MSSAPPRSPLLIGVMGPTASGKSALAEQLAEALDAQLVNADAFQIYRGMDIGTAKPERTSLYELIDIKDPSEGFGVGEFVTLAGEILGRQWESKRNVVIVGGTGLYLRALFEEYDAMGQAPSQELRDSLNLLSLEELHLKLKQLQPEAIHNIDFNNRIRVQRLVERIMSPKPSVPVHLPPFEKHKFALIPDPDETSKRIRMRTEFMFRKGWVDEVKELIKRGFSPADPGMRALGYGAIWRYLNGDDDLRDAQATTIADTRKYAKRQRTWLRSEPNLVSLNTGNAFDHAMQTLNGLF